MERGAEGQAERGGRLNVYEPPTGLSLRNLLQSASPGGNATDASHKAAPHRCERSHLSFQCFDTCAVDSSHWKTID